MAAPKKQFDVQTNKELSQDTEADKELPKDDGYIYFSMNAPNWFINKTLEEKCEIVEALAEKLKGAKEITPQQKKELFSID